MMENDILQQILIELKEVKNDVQSVKQDLQEVKKEVQSVHYSVILIENDHGEKIGALLDGQCLNTEKLKEHSNILGRMDRKLDQMSTVQNVHDIKLQKLAK